MKYGIIIKLFSEAKRASLLWGITLFSNNLKIVVKDLDTEFSVMKAMKTALTEFKYTMYINTQNIKIVAHSDFFDGFKAL